MIDGYVYAEIKKILQTADADAFDGYALTAHISERDLTKYSQALYPLLKNYFGSNTSEEYADIAEEKNQLFTENLTLIEEALFYKSIIKKLIEVSK
jgi:uncharacterized protein YfaP (DUF2135 family)